MTPSTYFETIPIDNAENIVRHVSKHPRHPFWHHCFRPDQFCKLVETGGTLRLAVSNQFNGISTSIYQHDLPDIIVEEDKFTRLNFFAYDKIHHRLTRSMVHVPLRSLILTPRNARILLKASSFFPSCTASVVDLRLDEFHDADKDVISGVLRHTGSNLTSFHSSITCRAVLESVHKYCTSLTSLTLKLIGADTRGFLLLSSVGDWDVLAGSLRKLTLSYCRPCSEEDAYLIRTKFRNLSELGVTLSTPKPFEYYKKVLKFYGGVDKSVLKRANLGDMPAKLITELRNMYPYTRLSIRLRASEMLAQLEAGGEALWSVTDFRRRPRFIEFEHNGVVAEATAKCTRLEELRILYPLRVSMLHVRKLFTTSEDEKYLDFVAKNTGALEQIVIKGEKMRRETLELLARYNPRLARVHIVAVPHMDEIRVADSLMAFLWCQDLQQISITNDNNMPVYPPFSITPVIETALAGYRMRKTDVRFGNLVPVKR